jgi:hypothetical protein
MRMAEAEYNLTAQAMESGQQSAHDKRLRVQFGMYPQIDQAATIKEARPIYKDAEYITIMVPGERDIVHRAAWQKDYDRFPEQYAAFKNKQNQDIASGTPLKLLTWLTIGQVKELEYFNCYTVEQLANMPDSTAQKFLQINKLKQLAKDYLVAAKEQAPLTAMRAALDERDGQIAAMKKQMDAMSAKLDALGEE